MSLSFRQRRGLQPYTASLLDDANTIAARRMKRDRQARRQRTVEAITAPIGFAWLRLKADTVRHRRAILTHIAVAATSAALALLIAAQPVLDAAR